MQQRAVGQNSSMSIQGPPDQTLQQSSLTEPAAPGASVPNSSSPPQLMTSSEMLAQSNKRMLAQSNELMARLQASSPQLVNEQIARLHAASPQLINDHIARLQAASPQALHMARLHAASPQINDCMARLQTSSPLVNSPTKSGSQVVSVDMSTQQQSQSPAPWASQVSQTLTTGMTKLFMPGTVPLGKPAFSPLVNSPILGRMSPIPGSPLHLANISPSGRRRFRSSDRAPPSPVVAYVSYKPPPLTDKGEYLPTPRGQTQDRCNCTRTKCDTRRCKCYREKRKCVGCNCVGCNNRPADGV